MAKIKNTRIVGSILALVIIALAAYVVFRKPAAAPVTTPPPATQTDTVPNEVPPVTQETAPFLPPAETPKVTEKNVTSHYSGEEGIDGLDVAVFEVVYDGKAYTPSSLTVKAGDLIVFKNASKADFWPASAPHPTHTAYPEFDAKSALGPGKLFQFKLIKPGTWKYHDHLNPSAYGTIVVTK